MQIGACYIRVSTEDQTEYSPTAQLKALKKYAKDHDIILSNEFIFIDEGISGRKADKRPEFMRMISIAKSKPKPFDLILTHKFDRFARSREDSVVYKSLLRKEAGIKVVSITESIEDDKFSIILEAILEAMAEYYSINLSEEVKKGMVEKADRGEPQGNPPFGYKMKEKNLVIIPEEAKIVKMIFQKFSTREQNMRQLANTLNDLGIRTHRNSQFETRTIEYILNNVTYIGKIRWNQNGRMKRNYNSPDLIIRDGNHTPLVDIDTWEKTQKILDENKMIYGSGEKSSAELTTWLKGLIRCSSCNRTLVTANKGWLRCNGYSKGQCNTANMTKITILEDAVMNKLKETYSSDIKIDIVRQIKQSDKNLEHDIVLNQLEKLKDKEIRIKIAYEDGIDTLEEYKANKKRLLEERKKLLNQKAGLNSTKTNQSKDQDIRKQINSVYDLLNDSSIDLETKHKTAHFLIEKIIYSKGESVLKLIYKL